MTDWNHDSSDRSSDRSRRDPRLEGRHDARSGAHGEPASAFPHESARERRAGGEVADSAEKVDRDELLQLAELDVRAVIEPVESARFERLFAAASPSLQAEVIALQSRLAVDPAFLSRELPPDSLRLRTLGRVAHAIDQESAVAKPIATIGPRSAASSRDGASISPDSLRSIIDSIARERERLQVVRQPYWRAAAFFLLAALCVSIFFNWRYVTVSEKLANYANGEVIDADMRVIASSFAGFDFGRSRHVDLIRLDAAPSAHVEIFADAESGRIAVLGMGFDVGETLEIVIRDPEGGAPYSQRFRATAAGFGAVCSVAPAMARAGIVEIRNGDGVTLFRA
jgi:hypothetical protein